MNCPCKDCTVRHQSCHSECDLYKQWVALRQKQKSDKKAQENGEKDTREFFRNSRKRWGR